MSGEAMAIEILQAEIERLRGVAVVYERKLDGAISRAERAEAEADSLRKNAERWRWVWGNYENSLPDLELIDLSVAAEARLAAARADTQEGAK